ncbi:MAG: (Fe-S)-binding protein [Hyphomicrobiaceae bacterium]
MSDIDNCQARTKSVGLFVTCLVDFLRPSIGWAAVKLLQDAGCKVEVPAAQTCCGQPAWNSGDRSTAQDIARDVIKTFETYDYVVVPSGSCAATLVKDFPEMLRDDEKWAARARALAVKSYELISFLTDVLHVKSVDAKFSGNATYHDSCSGLRSLGIKNQPRQLLASVDGMRLVEMQDAEVCCGFGGTFCVKYSDISNVMVGKKSVNVEATQAPLLMAGDLGCLMNIKGKLSREEKDVEVRHVAEVLAGTLDTPGIGDKP